MKIFTDEIGNIKLNGKLVPGVLESLDVLEELVIDEEEVKGRSGKVKQVKGYTDGTMQVKVVLNTDENTTCYEKLQTLQGIFRKTDSQAKPIIYEIVNKHVNTRNIHKVLLNSMKSAEDNSSSDTINVSISFVEYASIQITKETRVTKPTTAPKTQKDVAKAIDSKITAKYKSPAVDNAKAPKVKKR